MNEDNARVYKGYILTQTPFGVTVALSGQGGKIPNVMSGLFTSYSTIHGVIDRYLETQGKGKNASKTNSTDGDE